MVIGSGPALDLVSLSARVLCPGGGKLSGGQRSDPTELKARTRPVLTEPTGENSSWQRPTGAYSPSPAKGRGTAVRRWRGFYRKFWCGKPLRHGCTVTPFSASRRVLCAGGTRSAPTEPKVRTALNGLHWRPAPLSGVSASQWDAGANRPSRQAILGKSFSLSAGAANHSLLPFSNN